MDAYKFMSESDFNWLMLATKYSDDDRPWMECMHVIDGKAYTTDGHRMHVAPTKLDNGIYDAYAGRATPADDTDEFMPKNLDLRARFEGWQKKLVGKGDTVLLSDMDNQGGFDGSVSTKCGTAAANRMYMIQALYGMQNGESTKMNFGLLHSGENMFFGTDGTRSFVVMGLRI